jgi:hypothetical protein
MFKTCHLDVIATYEYIIQLFSTSEYDKPCDQNQVGPSVSLVPLLTAAPQGLPMHCRRRCCPPARRSLHALVVATAARRFPN